MSDDNKSGVFDAIGAALTDPTTTDGADKPVGQWTFKFDTAKLQLMMEVDIEVPSLTGGVESKAYTSSIDPSNINTIITWLARVNNQITNPPKNK